MTIVRARFHLQLTLIVLAVVNFVGVCAVRGQGSQADYDRAKAIGRLTQNKVYRDQLQTHWFADDNRLWYRVETAFGKHEFVLVDVAAGKRELAFDHGRLAAALTKAGVKNVTAERLDIAQLDFSHGDDAFDLQIAGQTWQCQRGDYSLTKMSQPGEPTPPSKTNDRGGKAVVGRGGQASVAGGGETSLTFINRTADTVELQWIDAAGARNSYGAIKPGESHPQHTYVGHVWTATNSQGQSLGVYVAGEKAETIEIAAPATEHSKQDRPAPSVESPEVQSDELPALAFPSEDAPADSPRGKNKRPRRTRPVDQSPDGHWQAMIKTSNVYLHPIAGGDDVQLSTDGTPDNPYSARFYWSPDSQRLVAIRSQPGEEHNVSFIESSPSDQVQPKLHTNSYLKPGDRLPRDRPQMFDVAAKKPLPVANELFANPWSIDEMHWAADSSRFLFLYNQRGHQALRLLAIDAASGAVHAVIDESSNTFIDYSGKFFLEDLPKTNELIWMSERDGWNHLYLYDAIKGAVKNQITRGDWVVRGVDRVDADKRQIWFHAGGIRPEQDPYFVHFCRVDFDGQNLVVLTAGDGTHKIEFSPNGKTLIDRYSRVDLPVVTELRSSADGKLICELERADWSALRKTGWQLPEPFVAKARDGTTDIYGLIVRPSNFDASKKYPIVERIYAGPQDSYVPKAFSPQLSLQAMAELGFVVVEIDGLGTSNRSKAFHDVCWKNLADAGLPDRIGWIKAAAAKYSYMDLSRVGIYGGSAGGQNAAAAAMTHGDFYRVAVADCGCHDNRMDKIWWNEQWMGWPIGPQYAANSNVTLARGLKAKLLLIVAEMDTNVDPASTMQVVNALVKADKDFEMLVIPGSNHGAAESAYGSRRRADFLVRHLLGVEPRWKS